MKACGFLLALAFAALTICNVAHCFDNGKVYNYKLDGSVLSKLLNEDNTQSAGVLIKSNLGFKKLHDGEYVIKLNSPTFAPINRQIKDDFDSSKLPFKPFESAASLEKAFRVYLEDNGIKAFDSFKDEPKWVSNFKRGLLSFFQLKLTGDQDGSSSYFTASEKSIFGDCDTEYVVLAQGNDARLNVTKTRNLAKCNSRFLHKFMPIDTSDCGLDDKDMREFKNANSMFMYSLSGSRSNYVIESASLVEQTVFSPIGRKGVSPAVDTKFNIALDSANSDAGDLSVDSSNAIRVDNLAYEPPELLNFYANVNLDDEHHLANVYSLRPSVEQVFVAFEELASELKKYTATLDGTGNEKVGEQQSIRNPELFMRLVDLVGSLNSAKLDQLYSKVEEASSELHKKIFWDVMSIAGTNPSFMFMKKLIVEGDAPAARIKDYLTRLSFHVKAPSMVLFDEYINLCKAEKIQANKAYRRLCSLPLASLINQHCVKPHIKYLRMQQEGLNATAFKKAQNLCRVSTAEEYFVKLVSPISRQPSLAESPEQTLGEKLFNIRMAGELGVKPSLDLIAGVIRNNDEHPSLRSAAMWNLIKPAAIYPSQVKKLVVPYFYDANEPVELRIAAFYAWVQSGISSHELEGVATKMLDDPNSQVATYIASYIGTLAEANLVQCPNRLAKDAQLAVPAVEKLKAKYKVGATPDSSASMSVSTQTDFSYETTRLKSFIHNNDSWTSANFFYGETEHMSGLQFTPLTVSVQAHGLDRIANRVRGLFSNKNSLLDIFSLKKRESGADSKADSGNVSDTFLSVTVSMYGRVVLMVDADSRELKRMMSEDGTIKIPNVKKLLHSFNNHTSTEMMINFEKMELFNNEMGLPIVNFFSDFGLKTFKLNSVKFDVEPGFFRDERQGKPPTRITASIDARSSKHSEFFAALGPIFESSKQRFGAGFYKRKLVNLPTKLSVDVNLIDSKLSIKRNPLHENLLYIKQYPLTFVKSIDEFSSAESKPSDVDAWLPLYNFSSADSMKPFQLEYMTPLAIGLKVQGKHKAGEDWSHAAWRKYLASKDLSSHLFHYKFSPQGKPLEVAVSTSTTGANDNPTSELTYNFAWKHALHSMKNFSVEYSSQISGGGERKVDLDVQYSRNEDLRKWKLNFQRSPLGQPAADGKPEVTNMCWIGSATAAPQESVLSLVRMDKLLADKSLNVTSNLLFGDDCSGEKAESAYSTKVDGRNLFELSDAHRASIAGVLGGRANY